MSDTGGLRGSASCSWDEPCPTNRECLEGSAQARYETHGSLSRGTLLYSPPHLHLPKPLGNRGTVTECKIMNERSFIPKGMPSTATRKAKIEAAARRLFADEGYQATSMRAIAEEAGVSTGLAYNYFEGKTDLLRSILANAVGQVRGTLAVLQDDAGRPAEKQLETFVRVSLDTVRAHRDFWKVIYRLRQDSSVLLPVQEEIDALVEVIEARLTSLMGTLGSEEPVLDARLLFASIDGTAQHYVRAPHEYPLDDVADRIVARFRARPA